MTVRILVVMPTYNELANVRHITERLHAAVPECDLLIIDDGSPDGTGDVADELARSNSWVHVIHRSGKLGLGTAYVEGFRWAIAKGYDVVVEMDADGSHLPEQLPDLIDALGPVPPAAGERPVDLVIGSRWVPGGRVINWPRYREFLSRGGNTYARIMLGIPLRDATAGFRAYRVESLSVIDLDSVESHGYCFQIDMAWRLCRAGRRVVEVPITFVEREYGESKMSRAIIVEAMSKVTGWGLRARFGRGTRSRSAGGSAPSAS